MAHVDRRNHLDCQGNMIREELHDLSVKEESRRRGYRQGWAAAIRWVDQLAFVHDRDRVYDILFAHWETDLWLWLQGMIPNYDPPVPRGALCHYCDEEIASEMDHVVPRSRGGSNDPSNLVLVCAKCNQEKSNRTPEEWRAGIKVPKRKSK